MMPASDEGKTKIKRHLTGRKDTNRGEEFRASASLRCVVNEHIFLMMMMTRMTPRQQANVVKMRESVETRLIVPREGAMKSRSTVD